VLGFADMPLKDMRMEYAFSSRGARWDQPSRRAFLDPSLLSAVEGIIIDSPQIRVANDVDCTREPQT